jgi:pimeloyl-ACP methyl ester carboxylesterase
MKLFFREYSEQDSRPPVLLLHGILGSLVNWQRIARALAQDFWVIVPDLRNHGRSPHARDVSYRAMAVDVVELLDALQIPQAAIVGHSMGGKTAMTLALLYPQRVERLAVVDIAPVTYSGNLAQLLEALLGLPLDKIENRRHADELLAEKVADKAVRDHMLQNLQHTDSGWRWRNNLRALRDGLDIISAFPDCREDVAYTGKTLFIAGEQSNYIQPAHQSVIRQRFPHAEIVTIADAGHWVYAERPQAFLQALQQFLQGSSA